MIGVDGVAHRGDWPDRGSWGVRRLPPLAGSGLPGNATIPTPGRKSRASTLWEGCGSAKETEGKKVGRGRGDEGKGKAIYIYLYVCVYIYIHIYIPLHQAPTSTPITGIFRI